MSENVERIDTAEALALLERAVAEKGEDYIYPQLAKVAGKFIYGPDDYHSDNGVCVYQTRYTRQPACIVGHALHYRGLLQNVVDAGRNEGCGPHILADKLGLFTGDAADFLSEVQGAQDGGKTWGAALRVGLAYLADREVNA